MNYYKQGDAANADKIKAAFEELGMSDLSGYNFGNGHALFYTYDCGGNKVIAIVCVSLHIADIIKSHPDYKELELPVEPKFKAEDRIVSKSDKITIYRIITLHEERREYIVEIEHKDYHESCPWIAFEDQDDYELAPKPHYDIANFKPFDRVLVRYYSMENWKCGLFSHLSTHSGAKFVCVGAIYVQCIPFNEETKHLLGTTEMCPQEYINW